MNPRDVVGEDAVGWEFLLAKMGETAKSHDALAFSSLNVINWSSPASMQHCSRRDLDKRDYSISRHPEFLYKA
ncbi:hypothetical protein KSP40_PGU008444 [Platanthera guangdongensis]|uniref:Uncharacterized protein n=1 Tax=Platanthera guangdongensis TaxID=2320717 RepID=A0ABR2LV09_9ASPA